MKPRLLLINDTTNWYHFGCTATSLALKEALQVAGYELTAIPITETYKMLGIPAGTVEAFESSTNFDEFAARNAGLGDEIKAADMVIINGEGTIHGASPAALTLLYLAFVAKKFLNKHTEIVNHSVYPEERLPKARPMPRYEVSTGLPRHGCAGLAMTDCVGPEFAADSVIGSCDAIAPSIVIARSAATQQSSLSIVALYKLVYSCLDFCSIREPASFGVMRELGLQATAGFDCSPLYIRDHYQPHGRRNSKMLLTAGSAAWMHLNIPSDESGNIEDFDSGIAGFASYLNQMAAKGFEVKFLFGASAHPAKDDKEFLEFIGPKLNFSLEVLISSTVAEWLAVIEQAAMLVSGRFHHTIAAACLGTPFILLNSNTPKVNGLSQLLDYGPVISYKSPRIVEQLLASTAEIERGGGFEWSQQSQLEQLCLLAERNFIGARQFAHSVLERQGQRLTH